MGPMPPPTTGNFSSTAAAADTAYVDADITNTDSRAVATFVEDGFVLAATAAAMTLMVFGARAWAVAAADVPPDHHWFANRDKIVIEDATTVDIPPKIKKYRIERCLNSCIIMRSYGF